MTERERLIEILLDGVTFTDEYKNPARMQAEYTADHLLANGVIVPPVNVGQIVYVVDRYYTSEWEIYECEVDSLTTYKTHTFMELVSVKYHFTFGVETSFVGVEVFLTKEEAEEALKEKQG